MFFLPSFRSFRDRGDLFFCFPKGGGDKRTRLMRKIRSTTERKIFRSHSRHGQALAGLEAAVYLCGKIISPAVMQNEKTEH